MELRAIVMTQARFGLSEGRRVTTAERDPGVLQTLVDTGAAKWVEDSPAADEPPKRSRKRALQPDGDDAAG